ncbi:MAG TPA: CotH kinase family protein, partial [Candidatus Limnocylindria bacterium]|nr:CotH kinase family protein [Candidatus Limnocylindria bacterium]
PRVSHAIVILNGRTLGMYVMKEGWDKPFLKRNFGSSKGNLYDPNFVQDVNGHLERDSGEGEDTQADIAALVASLQVGGESAFTNSLAKVLDCNKFLTYVALEVLIDDWDGYARNRNNYRIYHDPTTDRLVFMPHGMDQLYQSPMSSFRPNFNGIVARRLFSLPTWREALGKRMLELTNTVYNVDFADTVIAGAEKKIVAALAARGDDQAQYIRGAIVQIRHRMHTRIDHFSNQGTAVPQLVKFDPNGVCRLTSWQPKREGLGPRLEVRTNTANGKVFVVHAGDTGSIGSWRSSVILPPGNYRFEGKAMTRGVRGGESVQNVGVGAGIRISRGSRRNSLVGDTEWQSIQYQFNIDPETVDHQMGGREITLVAELRADEGDVFFDADSFVLRRL